MIQKIPEVEPPGIAYDPGIARRAEPNEDAYGTPESMGVAPSLVAQKGRLYVVCDGMGGHNAGDVASQTAVRRIFNEFYADPSPDPRQRLERALQAANAEIQTLAAADPARQGMGTTCVAAVRSGNDLLVANVGDSRAYLAGPDGIRQITVDHSLVQHLVSTEQITPEEADSHPERHLIYRSLGQAAFSAIGGYTGGILAAKFGWPFWACLVAGGQKTFDVATIDPVYSPCPFWGRRNWRSSSLCRAPWKSL